MTLRDLHVVPVPGFGAEDVLVDNDGWVWTGTDDGSLFRIRPDGGRVLQVARTGGRPMGLELLPDGRVLVCDAKAGLVAVDAAGAVEVLATCTSARGWTFLNNAAVHSSGDVLCTDSSAVHGVERWEADIAEDTHSGRLLRVAPGRDEQVLLDGLRFANGVALTADETAVLVAETSGRRILRHHLVGPQAGRTDELVADLPGYPDNLSRGSDGLVWAAIASPTDPVLERLMRSPLAVRKLMWRLPSFLRPAPARTVRVMAFDDGGTLHHDVSLDASRFHMATGVREHDGRVWLGSLLEPAVAWFEL